MNEMFNLARGLVSDQISVHASWRADDASLRELSVAGTDGIGQLMKTLVAVRDEETHKVRWQYRCPSCEKQAASEDFDSPDGTAEVFYDELPLRVRLLDFGKATGETEVRLFPTMTVDGNKVREFQPAKISWNVGDRTIEIDVKHPAGKDHFVLDRDFPFLLREWQMADGSRLRMKASLRLDCRDYLKNGDRERALKDPMLRHPD
jgi:hypothetical protein